MSRRERRKRMTMSVWEQRTSQLRRHRQMSSREILFSSPSEERDGPPASAHHLSLHRKALEQTSSGSLKQLKEPLGSPTKNQTPDSSAVLDPTTPDAAEAAPEPTGEPLPDASPSEPDANTSTNLGVEQCQGATSERRSPRLNGDRQHRAVKKFRPPDSLGALTPERGELLDGRRCRRGRGQGSSPGNGCQLASRSVSRERRRNHGKAEETEAPAAVNKEEEEPKTEESR